jgi:hypothetical protein
MSQNMKIEPDKIHIVSIKTLSGSINTETAAEIKTDSVKAHKFNFNLDTGFSVKEKMIGLKLKIDINGVNAKNEEVGINASYTHEIIFKVENLDDFIVLNDNKEPEIHWLLGSTIVSIAYSTLRGLIYSRTQGTPLNAVILPVVDPRKIAGLPIDKKEKNEDDN